MLFAALVLCFKGDERVRGALGVLGLVFRERVGKLGGWRLRGRLREGKRGGSDGGGWR